MQGLGRSLMLLGLVLLVVGAWISFGPSLPWLGKLPGDLRIERPGVRFYFPVVSCLLLSGLVSLLLYVIQKLR